ncbi:hypothetical protein D3C72_792680 [compost metagenome]
MAEQGVADQHVQGVVLQIGRRQQKARRARFVGHGFASGHVTVVVRFRPPDRREADVVGHLVMACPHPTFFARQQIDIAARSQYPQAVGFAVAQRRIGGGTQRGEHLRIEGFVRDAIAQGIQGNAALARWRGYRLAQQLGAGVGRLQRLGTLQVNHGRFPDARPAVILFSRSSA